MAVRQDNIYYDVVLTGKTGMGKSTLGNKLLQIRDEEIAVQRFTSTLVGLLRPVQLPLTRGRERFATTDDISPDNVEARALSVTNICELLANEQTKIRVLDVPGFSDSGALHQGVSIYEGNLQVIRQMVRVQVVMNLQVRRVVYFLPVRGTPERADASMQEELKVMYHFFGAAIFNCMVIVATNSRYQQHGYDEGCREQSKRVFHTALKLATENNEIGCPPIVYIGIKDESASVVKKIRSAEVLNDEVLQLRFIDDVCSRCTFKIRKLMDQLGEEVVGVVDSAGAVTKYEDSQCHPCFVPKYANWEKFLGGFGHIYTFGLVAVAGAIIGSTIWPGFTNSDEKCPVCQKSPGSKGCRKVGQTIECDWPNPPSVTMQVDHTNKL